MRSRGQSDRWPTVAEGDKLPWPCHARCLQRHARACSFPFGLGHFENPTQNGGQNGGGTNDNDLHDITSLSGMKSAKWRKVEEKWAEFSDIECKFIREWCRGGGRRGSTDDGYILRMLDGGDHRQYMWYGVLRRQARGNKSRVRAVSGLWSAWVVCRSVQESHHSDRKNPARLCRAGSRSRYISESMYSSKTGQRCKFPFPDNGNSDFLGSVLALAKG